MPDPHFIRGQTRTTLGQDIFHTGASFEEDYSLVFHSSLGRGVKIRKTFSERNGGPRPIQSGMEQNPERYPNELSRNEVLSFTTPLAIEAMLLYQSRGNIKGTKRKKKTDR